MPSKEILTLQFGHYSNFVGAHWWNTQERSFIYNPDALSEINNDILFREGLTLKGETTFTPRLLLVDLKGSLKSLRQDGDLYKINDDEDDATTSYEVIKEETPEKNPFLRDLESNSLTPKKIYDLDNEVSVWSDILYTRFHPRSVNIIREYQHKNEHTPFNLYPLGANVWKNSYFSEDFGDKIRNYIEESDNFEGFHVLLDSIDGFSGLAVSCIENINDEYANKAILGFPLIRYLNTEELNNSETIINLALTFDNLAQNSSLFIPLSLQDKTAAPREFNNLIYNPDLMYHSSAILASFLDTFSLNYRLKACRHSLYDFCKDFSAYGRKAAAASLNLPFALNPNQDLLDYFDTFDGNLFNTITPSCNITSDKNLHALTIRGVSESRLKKTGDKAKAQRELPAYHCQNIKDMLSFYMDCNSFRAKTDVTVAYEAMPVKTPFPRILRDININRDYEQAPKFECESVNVLAGVHSGEFIYEMFDGLIKDVENVKFKKCSQFHTAGLESDEFNECYHRILDLRDCYKDEFDI